MDKISKIMMFVGMVLLIFAGCGIDAPDANLKLLACIGVVGMIVAHAGFKIGGNNEV